MSTTPARERIIEALPGLTSHSLLSVADIAYAAGVAESTVRRHLDSLIRDGYLQHTSYVRYYATTAWAATPDEPDRRRQSEGMGDESL